MAELAEDYMSVRASLNAKAAQTLARRPHVNANGYFRPPELPSESAPQVDSRQVPASPGLASDPVHGPADDGQAAEIAVYRNAALNGQAGALIMGRFKDPAVTLAMLGDLTTFAGPAGVDTAALTAHVQQLATDHPSLLAASRPPGLPPGR